MEHTSHTSNERDLPVNRETVAIAQYRSSDVLPHCLCSVAVQWLWTCIRWPEELKPPSTEPCVKG